MHAEHVERVVGAEDLLQAVHAPQAGEAGDGAEHHATDDADVAGGRSDGDEAGDGTRSGAQHRGLALHQRFTGTPGQHRSRGRQEGVQERQRGTATGFERRAGVEAEPAHPQQRGTDHRQRQRVRREGFLAVADALADQVRTHEAGDSGVDVHDGTAREVERAPLPDHAGGGVHLVDDVGAGVGVRTLPEPDHVGDRQVAEREPQHHEDQHGRELDAFRERADDQAAGDGREGGLEHDVSQFRDHHALAERRRIGEGAGDRIEDPAQEQPAESADELVAFRERQAVAVDEPEDDDQREGDEHLHQHGQHVLAAHQAAVEQRQAGDRHHDDEHRGDQHPGGVTLVDGLDDRRRGRRACRGSGGGRRGGAGCRRAGSGRRDGRSGRRVVCRERCRGEPEDGESQGEGSEKLSHGCNAFRSWKRVAF